MFYHTIHFKFVQNNFSISQKNSVTEAFISVQNKAVFWSKPLLWKETTTKKPRRSEFQENKCHVAEVWQDRLWDPSLLLGDSILHFNALCNYLLPGQMAELSRLSFICTGYRGWAPCNLKYVFPCSVSYMISRHLILSTEVF